MLEQIKDQYGEDLQVNWKYFALEQVNSTKGPEWKLWEQPDDFPSRGLWSFRAAEAARWQGPDKFEEFHSRLLKARHEDRKDIGKLEVLEEVAQEAGLDTEQFRRDIMDPATKEALGRNHTEAVEEHGVFGTPTIFPGNGHGFYLKLRPAPKTTDEALKTFQDFYQTVSLHPNIEEIKQSRPPQKD